MCFNKNAETGKIGWFLKICLPVNFFFAFSDQFPINYGYFMVKKP